ncbi:MAG TPA: Lrp/AsnC ligand binding domain-containing protein, partial [Candidatus Nitrosotenuis sp.]|jgi:DNA-binding Lrp family transcriptional regulator|nr:Lrp/AsnC ligand binding domain-containing protein [Candidatus Nitrosotenuis sp.]
MAATAYVLIETELGRSADVLAALREVPGVDREATSAVSGPYDIISLVRAETHNQIGRLVVNKIQSLPGVRRTLTCFWVEVEGAG